MDEYLQYMRTLRTQMNDVEDQAAKISVEEQMQITTIHTLEKDLNSAKSETKRLTDDTEQMVKNRGQLCSKILENQKEINSLESDALTLSQTLELIQQERSNLSAKLIEKIACYAKVAESMISKLQEQQYWLDSKLQNKISETSYVQTDLTKDMCSQDQTVSCSLGDKDKELLLRKLQAAKAKLDVIAPEKLKLASENSEMKQSIEQLKHVINDLKPELSSMNVVALEDEHKAVLLEKSGEMEYQQSLQNQLEKLKGISHVVKCACGEEYKVAVD